MALVFWAGVADAKPILTLPSFTQQAPVKRYRRRLQRRLDHYRASLLRAYSKDGLRAIKRRRPDKQLEQVHALQRLRTTLKALPDRRPVLVILEGGDCVGKTSTMDILARGFPGRVVKRLHYDRQLTALVGKKVAGRGALKRLARALDDKRVRRTDERTAKAWLRDFKAQLPKDGEVAILDRAQLYSGVIYPYLFGTISARQVRERIAAINDLEQELRASAHVVKLWFHANASKTAAKFAERELFHPEKLDPVDYQMLTERKKVRRVAKIVRRSTSVIPWHSIEMNHRSDGRLATIDAIIDELTRSPH